MAELIEAYARLRAWIRDFGHEKKAVFIADLTSVLDDLAEARKQLAAMTERAEKAESKLARLKQAADADQADLEKMRDGTKMTRHGLVQVLAWQQEDIAELRQRAEASEKRAAELEEELKGKTCPRCRVDGYWYRVTKIAEVQIAELQAENADLRNTAAFDDQHAEIERLEAENARLLADLDHCRAETGPESCAALAAENARLREAAKFALLHVEELRDAWMRGTISEHDGKGGTRSNRNVEAENKLRKALSDAE